MNETLSLLLDPGNLVVNLGSGLVVQLAYYYLLAHILPPRSKRAYRVASVSIAVCVLFVKPILSPEVRLPLSLAICLLYPVLMLQGPLFLRIVVCVLACLAETVGEVVCMAFWLGLTGLGKVDNAVLLEHLPAHLMGVVFGSVGSMALIMRGVKVAVGRLGLTPADVDPSAGASSWRLRYLWIVAVQLMLVYVVVYLGLDRMGWRGGTVAVVLGLLALCAVVDAVLFVQIGRSVARDREEVRARVLKAQASAYLAAAEPLQALLGDTARLRHDLRNHRGVAQVLCARGDYARAQAYLEELSNQIESTWSGSQAQGAPCPGEEK